MASYAETVPATLTATPPIVKYYAYTGVYFDIPEEACTIFATQEVMNWIGGTPWVFDHIGPLSDNVLKCFSFHPPGTTVTWLNNILIMRSCDGLDWRNYAMSCTKYTCPPDQNWTLSGATCTRPDSTCPVSDLPPITDPEILLFENNPNLSDTARLTPRMQTALSCLLTAAAAGSPKVGSAYRPLAYNQHLIDVWRKWDELEKGKNSTHPACAELKMKIRGHFHRHLLLESQRPVPGSPHTRGEAVDVTISLPPVNIDALAAGCQLCRPLPVKDRVHFIHR